MNGNKRFASDIISNLPSNVTDNILKDLPLRDAVRTSVLSSKWRYKWGTLPELVFDDESLLKGWDTEKLKAVVYQVLLFHRGPLIKFEFWYPPFKSCLDINNWIFILLKKNVQDFSFYLSEGSPCHEIPCHFFSFIKLRDLNLANFVFKPPPTFMGFSRLVNIDFICVTISSEMCGLFISGCPLLERLRLYDCADFDSLEINALNLKYFVLWGIFASVSLENTPRLAEISVTLVSWDTTVKQLKKQTGSEWMKFFHSLPAIEKMQLDGSFLESFAARNVPEVLPSTLNQLKVMVLSDVCYSCLDHVSWVFCLLRSSPNLHKLRITVYDAPIQVHVMEFLQAQEFSSFSLNQLREVEIRHFSGVEPEIHFVKLLLAHSKVLKKMVILHWQELADKEVLAMLKEVTRFPRASPKAEVIVNVAADDSDDD